jgi:hypothetical protein
MTMRQSPPVGLRRRGPSRFQREAIPIHNRITPRSGRREPRVSHNRSGRTTCRRFPWSMKAAGRDLGIVARPHARYSDHSNACSHEPSEDHLQPCRGESLQSTLAQSPLFSVKRSRSPVRRPAGLQAQLAARRHTAPENCPNASGEQWLFTLEPLRFGRTRLISSSLLHSGRLQKNQNSSNNCWRRDFLDFADGGIRDQRPRPKSDAENEAKCDVEKCHATP